MENMSIERQSTGIAKSAFAKEMAKRELAGGTFIGCDASGSMNESTETQGERRIDALKGIVYGLRSQHHNFRIIIFESNVYEADVIPEPTGGTNMAALFDYAREQGAKHLIVVSDGCPDSASHALAAARKLVDSGCKRIDVFYVGPKGAYAQGAQDFMQSLAKLTGANINSVSFGELENKVKLALTDGSADAASQSGPIAL